VGRLAALDRLADARVAFRVAMRPPRGALTGHGHDGAGRPRWDPLHASEFLHGRRRTRERGHPPADRPAPRAAGPAVTAWRVLGLSPGAEVAEIKRAYRRIARTVHPDLHPDASDAERRALETRFAEVTEAYRTLVA
jgi:DnaJ-domain-containing protein 1